MRHLTLTYVFSIAVVSSMVIPPATFSASATSTAISSVFQSAPIFIENRGQWDKQARFQASLNNASVWITSGGVRFELLQPITSSGLASQSVASITQALGEADLYPAPQQAKVKRLVVNESFVGANLAATIRGEGLLPHRFNYFCGSDPANWQTNVPAYSSVTYENIYDNIDLKYFHNGENLEYEFIAAPGADLSQIKIHYEGIEALSVNSAGDLEARSAGGVVLRELSPRLYQERTSGRTEMRGTFILSADQTFSIAPPSDYDASRAITIDPVVVFNTAFSNPAFNATTSAGNAISATGGRRFERDLAGDFYITGSILSVAFPPSAGSATFAGTDSYARDVFVNKYSGVDFSLIYRTTLGGVRSDTTTYSGMDEGWALAIDQSGDAYITGLTHSADFPTVNAYQDMPAENSEGLAFISKLSPLGDTLVYSTFFHGSLRNLPLTIYVAATSTYDITVDNTGVASVVGSTSADVFPVVNPLDGTRHGREDAFLTQFSPAGNELLYSTLLGGDDLDVATHIAIDNLGQSVIMGCTWSTDFPTVNEIQGANVDVGPNKPDVTISRISADGANLVFSSYLAGSGYDFPGDMQLSSDGTIFLTGLTSSLDFTILNAFDESPQGRFVSRISPLGALEFSTYLQDGGGSIAHDELGNVYVTENLAFNAHVLSKLSSEGNCLIRRDNLNEDGLAFPNFRISAVILGGDGTAYLTGSVDLAPSSASELFLTSIPPTPDFVCGDADNSCSMNIADVVFLIANVFSGGPSPAIPDAADANGDGSVNIADVTAMIATIFSGGPVPLCGTTGF